MMIELKLYNPIDFLQSKEEIASYLNAAYREDDPKVFLVALGHVAKIKGISQLAKGTGLNRESLYKVFSGETQPRWDTIQRVMKALEINIQAVA